MDNIKAIKGYAKQNNVPIIEDEGLAFLIKTIKQNQVSDILEIGSAIGYSSIMMALVDYNIHVDTIERDEGRYHEALNNINGMQLTDRIKVYHDDALSFDESLLERQYDLLFIDAAKAQYQKFFDKYETLLKPEGLVVIDNVNFHGFVDGCVAPSKNTRQLAQKIKKFRDWLLAHEDYEVSKHEVGDGIMLARKVAQK
jgi:predicted O-methyltransferase YrrM